MIFSRPKTQGQQPDATPNALIAEAARRVAAACAVAVLTGAGVSQESGIPTFRDAQTGLWARYDPTRLATREGFARDPRLVWEWYAHRLAMLASAQPNPGHRAIAELETLFPEVTIITQNIDGLHQTAGSTDVVELHGSVRHYKCLNGGHTGFTHADFAGQAEIPPRCPRCGDLLRPDVVWFGEMLPADALNRAIALSEQCDAMIVVGTSGGVQPAASLPFVAAENGAVVIDVNPVRGPITRAAQVFLQGPGGEILPRLASALVTEKSLN